MTRERIMPPGLCQNSRWEAVRFLPLRPLEKAIIKELVQRGRRGFSFPSHSHISQSTGYSKRSIRRGVERLVALGLVRRIRYIRKNGTRGVYYYYLTFAGIVDKLSNGHLDQDPPVTSSALNLKNQQLDSKLLDEIVELEKCVFSTIESVLDLRDEPELIDGSLLTEWLYYRSGSKLIELHDFVLNQAEQLRTLHQRHRTKLRDWHHFIQQLEGNAKSGAHTFALGRLHPKLERRVVAYLKQSIRKRKNQSIRLSCLPEVMSDDDGIVLVVNCSIDYRMLVQSSGLLKGVASAIGEPVRVRYGSEETDPLQPKDRN